MKQHTLRVLLAIAFVGLVIGNYFWAESRLNTVPPNLHIAVAAARSLDPGTILKKDDLIVRIRRVHSMDQAFDDPDRLVGRQLRTRAGRGAALEENILVPLAESRKRSGAFVVVVDADAARCVTRGVEVLLVPRGSRKRSSCRRHCFASTTSMTQERRRSDCICVHSTRRMRRACWPLQRKATSRP